MAELEPAALLRMIWLASPALPVGGFSYSEGLEAGVEAGRVHDEASARCWLLDHLHLVVARSEMPLVAAAYDAWAAHDMPRIAALNDWARCTRESAEFRAQAEQMGRSMLEWLRQRCDPGDARVAALSALRPAPTWPLAFALASVTGGVPRAEALLAFSFGWAENMVQAAVKAVPLGQSAGQRLLGALADALPALVEQAQQVGDDARQAFAPGLAILSAQHETQYSRLFRS